MSSRRGLGRDEKDLKVEEKLPLLENLYKSHVRGEHDQTLSVETLLDALLVLYDECCNSAFKKEKTILAFVESAKPVVDRVTRLRLSLDDFDTLEIIGRGAFGEVKVVKMKSSGKVFALKVLNKWEMLKRHQTACFREERDILVFGPQEWITTLHYAFQDKDNLYLVMDYYVGGDVLTLLSKYEDHLPEQMAKFYACEMVLAIDAIHQMGYVHRDIKPDNVLIDKDGHIRLADFGSCLKMNSDGMVVCTTAVGTPDYISPEILTAMEDGKGVYGCECDWWSLGICIYEMLFGETPFYAESLIETYGRIMQHKTRFQFPKSVDFEEASNDAKDLIKSLICDPKRRLGRNGIDDFKKHAFFQGMDWDNIRNAKPPYIPEYSSPTDTRNFDPIEDDETSTRHHYTDPMPTNKMTALTVHLPFVGFTFTHNSKISDNPPRPLAASADSAETGDAIDSSLKDENCRLLAEMESLKKQATTSTSSLALGKGTDAEMQSKLRTMERTSKSLKSEKGILQEEITSLRAQVSEKDKDLRGVKGQLQEVQDDVMKITTKLSDVRSQKIKFSRLAREKGEEIEEMLAKVDTLRKSNKELERNRRVLAADLEESSLETEQLAKQHKKTQLTIQGLEEEVRSMKNNKRRSIGLDTEDYKEEIAKLQAGLEDKEAEHAEAMRGLHTKHSSEIQKNKALLAASEATNTDLQKENDDIQLRLSRSRNRSVLEINQGLQEATETFEREKLTLMEQNKQLRAEVDRVNSEKEALASSRQDQEAELRELRQNKELLTQWERQIADIIQWVTEEKDARAYLKSVAKKLAEDVDNLKSSASTLGKQQKQEWVERRTLKRDKGELLDLQLQLKNEIEAKGHIQEQLSQVTSQLAEMETRIMQSDTDVVNLKEERAKLLTKLEQMKMGPAPARTDSTSHFFHQKTPELHRHGSTTSNAIARASTAARESVHELIVRTFDTPTKCDTCTSVMFGLVRQGLVCKNCQMNCHVHCKDKAVPTCPLPPGQAKLPFGIDVHHGVGTACEGWIKIPKPGGVRRGWQRAYAIVCDFKVFLHEPSNEDIHTPAPASTHIFDIRDQNFEVSKVTSHDVIHAGPKLIPSIFKICCHQQGCMGLRSEVLILTENEAEKDRWITTLKELQKATKQSPNQMTPVIGCREMYTTQQLEILKNTLSAAIATPERILLGDKDGLYMLDISDDGLYQFSDKEIKKVLQIMVIKEEGLIALLAGSKRPWLRLIPMSVLDSGELKNQTIKLVETEGASRFIYNSLGRTIYLCVAVKTRVIIYEISSSQKNKCEKKKEVTVPFQAQSLQMFNEKLCVGYQSGFSLFHVYNDEKPQLLVHTDDLTLGFIRLNNLPAVHTVEIKNGQEYILCFNIVGVYVNSQGWRSRKQELLWHSPPASFVYKDPYLLVYCESGLEVYDVLNMKWIQVIPFKKLHALSTDGSLTMCCANDPCTLLYLKKQMDEDILNIPGLAPRSRLPSQIRASTKIKKDKKVPAKGQPAAGSSKLAISGPLNFMHVQHYGPYESLNVETMPDAGGAESSTVPPVPANRNPPPSSISAYALSTMDEEKPVSVPTDVIPKSESMDFCDSPLQRDFPGTGSLFDDLKNDLHLNFKDN